MTLVCVTLGCPMTYERSMELFDDAFKTYSLQTILQEGDTLKTKDGVPCGKTRVTFSYPLLEEEKALVEITAKPVIVSKNRRKNQEITGQFEIYIAKRLLFSGNLYKL